MQNSIDMYPFCSTDAAATSCRTNPRSPLNRSINGDDAIVEHLTALLYRSGNNDTIGWMISGRIYSEQDAVEEI